MRRAAAAALWAAVALPVVAGGAPVAAAGPVGGGPKVTITTDRASVDTVVGGRAAFSTSVTNTGHRPLRDAIAHLDVVSTDPQVYVDPEDWSTSRTRYLGTVAPGATVRVPWRVQAVNSGDFVLYVVVTPARGAAAVAVGDGLRLRADPATRLAAGGTLPVVLGVPVLTLLASLLVAARRRARQR